MLGRRGRSFRRWRGRRLLWRMHFLRRLGLWLRPSLNDFYLGKRSARRSLSRRRRNIIWRGRRLRRRRTCRWRRSRNTILRVRRPWRWRTGRRRRRRSWRCRWCWRIRGLSWGSRAAASFALCHHAARCPHRDERDSSCRRGNSPLPYPPRSNHAPTPLLRCEHLGEARFSGVPSSESEEISPIADRFSAPRGVRASKNSTMEKTIETSGNYAS